MIDQPTGFDVDESLLNPALFDFQRALVTWAMRRGRAAIFADTGLGKTPIQLEWAKHVSAHTGGDVIIFAPLAVSMQTVQEGLKFGVDVTVCRSQSDVKPGINITNYDRYHLFDPSKFVGLVLDESSIIKAAYGKIRKELTLFASHCPYRLACTATPAPNDTMELVNHAEFLGIMSEKEALALYFTQDFTATSHKWKLKGHARKPFWMWLSSWARALRNPSDLGFDGSMFDLPELRRIRHTVETNPVNRGLTVNVEAIGLAEQREIRNKTIDERVAIAAKLVNESNDQWLVWCDLNAESAAAKKAIPGSVEVKGSDDREFKEKSLMGFARGEIRVLISKASIAGWGLNFQSCHNMIFLGQSNSFEQTYQAIRRCWRFGQKHPVNVHLITTDCDGAVIANIERKERQASEIFEEVLANMQEFQVESATRQTAEYQERVERGDGWELWLGDSVKTVDNIEDESVGLAVYSPPWPAFFCYSNSPNDIGNVRDIDEMIEQYKFLIGHDKLFRVLMPGRTCAVHLTQGVAFKHTDGFSGLKDFRGAVIKAHQDAGFIYYGEVVIERNPQFRALRTKDRGLLFKTLASDSAHSRMGLPDYVLQFRKPGENPEPIKAGKADHLKNNNGRGWISNAEWIEWANPIWYMHSDQNPGGIKESDVLSARVASDDQDEKHLCCLQLGVIERIIKLWSNPGDLIYSPFAGIGSEGYQALRFGRRFVGGELKESYFLQAIKNLRQAQGNNSQLSLLDMMRSA